MTTLLTGATGFLGSAIARELIKDGQNSSFSFAKIPIPAILMVSIAR
jgi:thioester reductase-like protein